MDKKIFGINSVKESLKSGVLEEIYVDKYTKNSRILEILKFAREKGINVNFLNRKNLTEFFGTKYHQGIGGILKNINLFSEDELIEKLPDTPLVVLLDGITDQHNLGAILRSCAAFNVDGVFIPKRRSAGFSDFVWKSSAGAIFSLNISFVTNLSRTIDRLKENFITIVGADVSGTTSLFEYKFEESCGIVFGSEGKGLRRLIKEKCDFLLSIPISSSIESLNVSVSAGIFLYEVARQRNSGV